MTVDLSTWKPGDWLQLRDGSLLKPAPGSLLDRGCGYQYPFLLCGWIPFKSDGLRHVERQSPFDVIEIIPSERMTLLEWIADREPTEEDAVDGEVVWFDNGKPISLGIAPAAKGLSPWAHCPGWQPPAPKPLTPEQEIATLKARVAELEERLNRQELMATSPTSENPLYTDGMPLG